MRSSSACFDSKPFFVCDSTATIAASAAPIDAASAETEPPPGAGASLESSSRKSRTLSEARRGADPRRYSITRSFASNGLTSLRPSVRMAVCISAASGTPVGRPILPR